MYKCEACGHEHEVRTCPKCHGKNPNDARYCCYCARALPDKQPQQKTGKKKDPYDLESRVNCSDGNCIGIINERGVCTDCGKPYEGDL